MDTSIYSRHSFVVTDHTQHSNTWFAHDLHPDESSLRTQHHFHPLAVHIFMCDHMHRIERICRVCAPTTMSMLVCCTGFHCTHNNFELQPTYTCRRANEKSKHRKKIYREKTVNREVSHARISMCELTLRFQPTCWSCNLLSIEQRIQREDLSRAQRCLYMMIVLLQCRSLMLALVC